MRKSYDLYILGLYEAVLKDIARKYPLLQKDLRRDHSRLLSYMETRGLSFFMIDLVEYGKHFDKCLSAQRLTRSNMAGQRPYKKGTVIPRLFKGLLSRVFHDNGELRSDCDIGCITSLRQLYLLVKKFRLECTNEKRTKVLRSFFATDSSIRRGSREWDYDDPRWPDGESVYFGQAHSDHLDSQGDLFSDEKEVPGRRERLDTLQKVADILSSQLGVFDPYAWRAKHGPGAVSDQKVGHSKYDFPTWPEKLGRVFPLEDFAFANYSCWADSVAGNEISGRFSPVEKPSKLITVPKTLKAPRLIASEPVSHQWCQQILKDFFQTRSQDTVIGKFVSFRDQTPNGRMALEGSQSGALSTVDLSEASDRVSLWSVERLFRRNTSILDGLHATRTRWCENTIDKKLPRFHKLEKFACMGSACTFPVESLLFLAIALAATLASGQLEPTLRNIKRLKGQVRVFGDDIIVPTDAVENLLDLLQANGLVVNQQKTFDSGRFRESCGVDAYGGHNVTPVYVMTRPTRSKPESVISAVATHNNFLDKGYFATANLIRSSVLREYSNIPEVATGSGLFGLWSGYHPAYHENNKSRYNRALHRVEYFVTQPYSRVKKSRDRGNSMILQYFTERPSPQDPWRGGVTSRPVTSLRDRWVAEGSLAVE